jgi:hypothetical protein
MEMRYKEIAMIWANRLDGVELKKLTELLEERGYLISYDGGTLNVLIEDDVDTKKRFCC